MIEEKIMNKKFIKLKESIYNQYTISIFQLNYTRYDKTLSLKY